MTLDTQGNAIIYNVCKNSDLNIKLGITHILISYVFSCRKTSILAGWLSSGLLQLEAWGLNDGENRAAMSRHDGRWRNLEFCQLQNRLQSSRLQNQSRWVSAWTEVWESLCHDLWCFSGEQTNVTVLGVSMGFFVESSAGCSSPSPSRPSHRLHVCPSGSAGSSAVLVLFVLTVIALLGIAAFVVYKKKRGHFSSTIRYERTLDDMDTTSIVTDTELSWLSASGSVDRPVAWVFRCSLLPSF